MSLYLYSQPLENSLFDDFCLEDDFFNHPLISRRNFFNYDDEDDFDSDNYLHQILDRRNHFKKAHRRNPFKTLEKQLTKAFKDDDNNEIFKLVEFSPKINLSEDENNYYIHADLPGMTKDQIKMELNDDHVLTISGERESFYDNTKPEKDEEKKEKKETDDKKETKETETEQKEEKIKTTEDKEEIENKKETEENNEKQEDRMDTEETKDEHKDEQETSEENKRKYSIMECSYGKFERSFTIPEDANVENIQAKMDNGVLEVIFNKIKAPKSQNRLIQIQ